MSAELPVIYTVACEFTDATVAEEWAGWLRSKHLREVLDAGAIRATLMRVHDRRYEVHYRFANRATYDKYIAEQAPRLREDGLARFPLERGLRYERHVAEVIEVMEK